MLYSFGKFLLNVLISPFIWHKAVGRENISKDGGVILAINHRSNWDVIIAGLACPRQLNFMAKKELFNNKFLGWLLRHLNAFPVSRGASDMKAIKTALSRLKDGKVLSLFPEGTRITDGREIDAKAGVAMFATRAKVPVIPTAIIGDYKLFGKIYIVFGEPVYLDEYYDQKVDMDKLHEISDDILNNIRTTKKIAQQQIENKQKVTGKQN